MLAARIAVGLGGLALGIAAPAASGDTPAPEGPRLAVIKVVPKQGRSELATLGPGGGDYRQVLAILGRTPWGFDAPAWSPDGTQLALAERRRGSTRISILASHGGTPRAVAGTKGGILPVFSPDGRSLAFTRIRRERKPGRSPYDLYESSAVWIVDLETGARRQLTRWKDNVEFYASSFSPDGSTLLVVRWDTERSQDPELIALRFDGRPSGLLVGEGAFPVYSPDGSKIALFRAHKSRRGAKESWELYVVDADGSHLRRLTRTPHKDEFFASWDPSGERIAYAQFRRKQFELPNAIMQINADGSCPTRVLSTPEATFYGPVWQPGARRGAGQIEC